MNALKLLVGWLFLAGLTAAGTFYAMDEIDHRVGLARFNLYEKLGVAQYAAAPAPPSPLPAPPAPAPVNPNPPPSPQPPISNPTIPPVVNPNPGPGPVVQPPASNPPPGPANPYTNPNPRSPVAPYTNPNPRNPVNPNPVNPNPVRPPSNQQQTPPVYAPTQQPAPSRPADFDEVNARYIDLSGQTEAMARFVDSVRRSAGSAGTGRLDGPMSSLRSSMRNAKQALDSGNTRSARTYLDQAEKYLQALNALKE